MEPLLHWLHDHPQFSGLGLGLLVMGAAALLVGRSLARSGSSLRPLAWFLGLFGILAGPPALVHLLDGVADLGALADLETASPARRSFVPATNSLARVVAPVPWSRLFGTNTNPALRLDARRSLLPIFKESEEAQLVVGTNPSSTLAARFPDRAAALRALDAYAGFFRFFEARGDATTGVLARRGGDGGWVHALVASSELYAWTAPTADEALEARRRTLGPSPDFDAVPLPSSRSSRKSPVGAVSGWLAQRADLTLVILAITTLTAGIWFLKGSAWAARWEADAMAPAATTAQLRQALLGLNVPEGPLEIITGDDGNLEVRWRHREERWFAAMRTRRLRRLHRLVLVTDEPNRTVRVREYWSAFDAAAFEGPASLGWMRATGSHFFALEHHRVRGLRRGTDGLPTGEWKGPLEFTLAELKGPVAATVTRWGWHWQPVAWDPPRPLRWLAE